MTQWLVVDSKEGLPPSESKFTLPIHNKKSFGSAFVTPNQTMICHSHTSVFKLQLFIHNGNWAERSPEFSL